MGSPYLPFAEHWEFIEAQITGGVTPEQRVVSAALRAATPEIDNLIALLHTPEIVSILQTRHFASDGKVVGTLFDALEALLFKPLPVVPADIQHFIADLIDPPARPAGRPAQPSTPMRRIQREIEKRKRAESDIAEMERLLTLHGTETAAFRAFSEQTGTTSASVKRRYRRARQTVEVARVELQESVKAAATYLGMSEAEFQSSFAGPEGAPNLAK